MSGQIQASIRQKYIQHNNKTNQFKIIFRENRKDILLSIRQAISKSDDKINYYENVNPDRINVSDIKIID